MYLFTQIKTNNGIENLHIQTPRRLSRKEVRGIALQYFKHSPKLHVHIIGNTTNVAPRKQTTNVVDIIGNFIEAKNRI